MQLPHFLVELESVEFLNLLHFKRDKGAWKAGFSCGDGILVVDVPDDDQGRKDLVEVLRSVATAVENDPSEQLGLFGDKNHPHAPPKPDSAEARTETLPGIEQPKPPPVSQEPPQELPAEKPKKSKPKDNTPKGFACLFDHGAGVGDEPLSIPAGDTVVLWRGPGKPEWDLLSIDDNARLVTDGKLAATFAAHANVAGNWVYKWRGDLRAYERLQATGKKQK